MKYAKRTQVPVNKSRSEIESTVSRYGADQFGSAYAHDKAMVQFRLGKPEKSWVIRFILPLPHENPQDQRQRWRALSLVIKAKLESVESGIATIEQEFLANIVTPGGQTMAELLVPQLGEMRKQGRLPTLDLLEDYRGTGKDRTD
jgi:hypothetical protein